MRAASAADLQLAYTGFDQVYIDPVDYLYTLPADLTVGEFVLCFTSTRQTPPEYTIPADFDVLLTNQNMDHPDALSGDVFAKVVEAGDAGREITGRYSVGELGVMHVLRWTPNRPITGFTWAATGEAESSKPAIQTIDPTGQTEPAIVFSRAACNNASLTVTDTLDLLWGDLLLPEGNLPAISNQLGQRTINDASGLYGGTVDQADTGRQLLQSGWVALT
jgi:hypothetical protein